MRDRRIRGILDLLAKALQVEYRIIAHYPKLMSLVTDESRDTVLVLGSDSIRHSDAVMAVIRNLGDEPPFPHVDPLPELPIEDLFKMQLEYEKLALFLHTEAARLAPPEHQATFQQLAQQERVHILGVERILERIRLPGPTRL